MPTDVNRNDFQRLVANDVQLVEVLPEEDHNEAHLPRAINIPLKKLNPQSLKQLFQDYVGIGLKWLLQRHRLLAAAQQIRETKQPNWASIAYDLGYSSKQHFITDFKQVLGKTTAV